jgi:hypothetical protein
VLPWTLLFVVLRVEPLTTGLLRVALQLAFGKRVLSASKVVDASSSLSSSASSFLGWSAPFALADVVFLLVASAALHVLWQCARHAVELVRAAPFEFGDEAVEEDNAEDDGGGGVGENDENRRNAGANAGAKRTVSAFASVGACDVLLTALGAPATAASAITRHLAFQDAARVCEVAVTEVGIYCVSAAMDFNQMPPKQ